MQKRKKKEIAIFVAVLALLGASFIAGVLYISSGKIGDGLDPLADASIVVTPPRATTSSAPVYYATSTPNGTKSSGVKATTTTSLTTSIPKSTPTSSANPQKEVTPKATSATTTTLPTPAAPQEKSPDTVVAVPLPYSIGTFGNAFGPNDGWTTWMGTMSQTDGVLTLDSGSTGGGVFLSGSNGWSEYTLLANVDWVSGDTFGIVGHYVDSNNYVLCSFSEPTVGTVHVAIHQHVDGSIDDLADGDLPNYSEQGGANLTVAFQIHGNDASCALGGHAISTVFSGNHLSSSGAGAIGFLTSDSNDNGEIVVHSIGVIPQLYNLGTYDIQDAE